MAFAYSVRSEVEDDATAERWRAWLRAVHLRDVVAAGALTAQLIELGDRTFESRFTFASRAAYEQYLSTEAPRLRAEVAKHFPQGITFVRMAGDVVFAWPRP